MGLSVKRKASMVPPHAAVTALSDVKFKGVTRICS